MLQYTKKQKCVCKSELDVILAGQIKTPFNRNLATSLVHLYCSAHLLPILVAIQQKTDTKIAPIQKVALEKRPKPATFRANQRVGWKFVAETKCRKSAK